LSAFLDTNTLVRHLTGEPIDMAAQSTAFLAAESELLLADLIVAETVYVLESYYQAPRRQVAEAVRSLISFPSIVTVDPALLLRAIELYGSIGSISPRRTSSHAPKAVASTGSLHSTSQSTESAWSSACNLRGSGSLSRR
jgi:predicted nucleic acid-binding protein